MFLFPGKMVFIVKCLIVCWICKKYWPCSAHSILLSAHQMHTVPVSLCLCLLCISSNVCRLYKCSASTCQPRCKARRSCCWCTFLVSCTTVCDNVPVSEDVYSQQKSELGQFTFANHRWNHIWQHISNHVPKKDKNAELFSNLSFSSTSLFLKVNVNSASNSTEKVCSNFLLDTITSNWNCIIFHSREVICTSMKLSLRPQIRRSPCSGTTERVLAILLFTNFTCNDIIYDVNIWYHYIKYNDVWCHCMPMCHITLKVNMIACMIDYNIIYDIVNTFWVLW